MKMRIRVLSLILALCMVVGMLPVTALAADDAPVTSAPKPGSMHQLLFLSDIHSGVHVTDKDGLAGSQYSNLKYMLANLAAEGLDPECVTCGGDYVRDEYGDYQGNDGWQTVFNTIDGTIAANFPNAKRFYTMGNHEWETQSMGSSSDKETLFKNLFGCTRSGVRIITDDYAIYQVGAQGHRDSNRERFSEADIKGVDDFLASMVGQQKVIFIQSHWPIHAGWNFNYRNITNAGQMLQTVNKYGDDLDIIWFWGHNHYGDPMRQTVKQRGYDLIYRAQQGQPNATQSEKIKFTYVSTGCMNDMWCDHTVEGFDRDPGPGLCSVADILEDKVIITYNHVDYTTEASAAQYNDGKMIFDHDATFYSKVPDESVTNSRPLAEAKVFANPSTIEIPLINTDFGAPSQYSVTVQAGRGGTASAAERRYYVGDEVTLTATAKDGYHFKEWQVLKGDVTIVNNKFTMPDSLVTVKALFESDNPSAGPASIDFTNSADADKFEVKGGDAAIVDGTGLTLVSTSSACIEPAKQSRPEGEDNVVVVPAEGDWTATLEFDFSAGSSRGSYEFFGFYAAEGDDYQNMVGIRGGDGAMQDFIRKNGAITEETKANSPGLPSAATHWLQIEKDGDTYICYRSSDGNDFTEMFRFENTGIEADTIVIDAYSGMATGYTYVLKALDFDGGASGPVCAHTDKETRDAKAATCIAAGYTGDTYCKICGKKLASGSAIAALGHDWDAGTVTKQPTETEAGMKTYACTRCDAKRTETIPATGASAAGWQVATEIEVGGKYVIVSNGYAVKNEQVPDSVVAAGTSLASVPVTVSGNAITSEVTEDMVWTFGEGTYAAATGYTGYFITANDGKYMGRGSLSQRSAAALATTDTVTNARNYFWTFEDLDAEGTKAMILIGEVGNSSDYFFVLRASAESTNAPGWSRSTLDDHKADGAVKLYKLTEGGVPATCDHANRETRNASAATCTAAGYTGDTYCLNCGEKLASGTAIAALGHDWDAGTVTKQPTETEAGVKTYACTRCDAKRTEAIPATGAAANGWTLASEIKLGGEYVIVSNGYAVKNAQVADSVVAAGTSLASVPVTVDGDVITSEISDDMVWTFSEGTYAAATGYTGYFITANDGKYMGRTSLSSRSAAALTTTDTVTNARNYFWTFEDLDADGTKAMILIGEVGNSGDYFFVLRSSAESTNAPGWSRDTLESHKADGAVKLYELSGTVAPCDHAHKEIRNASAATCTTAGSTGDTYCLDCGRKLASGAVIAALGHDWDAGKVTKEPTETERGTRTYTCTRCGATRTEAIPATGTPANINPNAQAGYCAPTEDTLHQLLFLSDIHSGVHSDGSYYSNLKYMLANLAYEGLEPECVTCGGDYVRDTYGGNQGNDGWQAVFDTIDGTIAANFPSANRFYTMGNHEWEDQSMGSSSDKETLFKNLFGCTRSGVRIVTDDYAIYQVGAQGNSGANRERFSTQDIQGVDEFLASMVGQQKVIFIQSHWPLHAGWNFNYRNITNAGTMIDTVNKYSEDLDIVWFWGHNHYGDEMRQTVQKPGTVLTHYAQQGNASASRKTAIGFTYVSTGCMNDMWCDHTVAGFDRDPGPGVCSYVDIQKDKIVITYSNVDYTTEESAKQYNNGEMIYGHDATFYTKVPNEQYTNDRPAPEPIVYNNPAVVEIPLTKTDFGAPSQYSVTVQAGRGGTASASDKRFYVGDEVTLTAAAKEGYHFKEWQVVKGDVTIANNKFTMPDTTVTVKAIFEKDANVTVTGYVLADTVKAGEKYVIVSNGYAVKNAQVADSVVAAGTSLASVPVTVDGDVITSEVDEDMLWTLNDATYDNAPGYTGYFITDADGKFMGRTSLSSRSAAALTTTDTVTNPRNYFWTFEDLDDEGTKAMILIGEVNNSGDYFFVLRSSAESTNAPGWSRDTLDSHKADGAVKLYQLVEGSGSSGLESIDFTKEADGVKFEIINNTNNIDIVAGTGLTLTATRPAFEDCNGQNSAGTPEEVVEIPVAGDWTATLTVDFSTGGANNGYYQFFGFYAAEGDDYKNMAGIRGGDGAMQDFLCVDGTVTAETMNSQPGFANNGTYYLQLVKEGTTYICLRSDDGEEFTEMYRFDTDIEAEKIVIDAYTGMTEGYQFTLKALDFEGGSVTPACPHADKETRDAKAATCTAAGYTGDTYCLSCGKKIASGTAIAALGHDMVKGEVTAPTCTAAGYTTYACSRCDATEKRDTVAALGHAWDEGVTTKPATETEEGIKTFTCTRCKETRTEKIDKLPVGHKHEYTATVTAPTCTEEGYTTHTCSCGDSYKDTVVPALGHDWDAGVKSEDGKTITYTCTRCGETKTEDAPAVHDCPSKDFSDVPGESDWAHAGIDYCVENGLMNGTSATLFSPKGSVTRAQLVTILYRVAGEPTVTEPSKFTDVPADQWYTDPIAWAAANGIVTGMNATTFAPMNKITREQIATILYRYTDGATAEGSIDSFPDAGKVSGWAKDALTWAVAENLITGVKAADGTVTLNPTANATRAQIASIIMRYLEAK